jgi:hypothetical protein
MMLAKDSTCAYRNLPKWYMKGLPNKIEYQQLEDKK